MVFEELPICCSLWTKVVPKEFYSLRLRKKIKLVRSEQKRNCGVFFYFPCDLFYVEIKGT